MMSGFDLMLKWETDGLDTQEETVELAHWLVGTGMVHSAGRYGRFVNTVLGGDDE